MKRIARVDALSRGLVLAVAVLVLAGLLWFAPPPAAALSPCRQYDFVSLFGTLVEVQRDGAPVDDATAGEIALNVCVKPMGTPTARGLELTDCGEQTYGLGEPAP
jgi:hypothetical protein